jgi:hypothetical protein
VRSAVAASLLLAVPLVVFADCVFRGRMLFQRDIDQYWYGTVDVLVDCVRHGVPPLWNPFDTFGQPLLALGPWQILYPTTWLTLLMPTPVWFTVFVVGHVAFTGFGACRLARRLQGSWVASVTAGGLWAASGPLVSLVTMTNLFAAACWLPWIVLAAEAALESRRLGVALVWGLTVAATVLAGSPEITLIGAALSAAIVAGGANWRRPASRANLGLLRTCAVAGTFALGLSAGQWLPTLDVHSRSARAQLDRRVQTLWSNHPVALSQALFPVPLDDLPLRPEVRADFFDSREPFLYSIYLGMASVALVGVALLGPPRPGRRLAALAGLVAGLLSMGRWTPLYGILSTLVPPLQWIRYPTKFTILLALCWALLAGMGLDLLRDGAWRGRAPRTGVVAVALSLLAASALALSSSGSAAWPALLVSPETFGMPYAQSAAFGVMSRGLRLAAALSAVSALLLAAFALGRPRRWTPPARTALAAALGGLALADALAASSRVNPSVPRALFAYRPPALQDVPKQPPNRVVVLGYDQRALASRHLGGGTVASLPFDASPEYRFWLSRVYPRTLGSGMWSIEGVGSQAASLRGREVDAFARALEDTVGEPSYRRLLELAGVRFVLAQHEDGLDRELELLRRVPGPRRPIRVFRVPDPAPEARVVGRASLAPDEVAFRRILADPTFDFRHEVLLAEAGPGAPSEPAVDAVPGAGPAALGADAVRVVERHPDRLVLRARSGGEGYLVVTGAWDPWWRATVDGRETRVLRANVAFRAVRISAGEHVVEMRYRPLPVYLGVACSVAFALAGLAALAWGAVRRPGGGG